MRIGNVEINSRLYLAPMAGVTDLAFRQICRCQDRIVLIFLIVHSISDCNTLCLEVSHNSIGFFFSFHACIH